MTLRLKLTDGCYTTIISAYAPTLDSNEVRFSYGYTLWNSWSSQSLTFGRFQCSGWQRFASMELVLGILVLER